MIIYNVTIKIDKSIHDDWLQWMKQEHIPDVLETGMFTDHKLCRLLEQDESEGYTYAIQYHCENLNDYEQYIKKFAPSLQEEHAQRFKDKFVAFRTLLEIVS